MHSVHLPFQCSKVYRLHDQNNQENSLILDFKLGTIDNRKDYLQTWGEFIIILKTGIRDSLLIFFFKDWFLII
jgi:hypothetical protein